jgi:membrane protein YqaA with SNARE-associated domain
MMEFFDPASASIAGLFFASLLSSTLLPGGSEAVLAALLLADQPALPLWIAATVGNTLGSLISFAMGWWLAAKWPAQKLSDPRAARACDWLHRHGTPLLLLAWLPIVGDPLCLAAGWLRLSPLASAVAIATGKGLRYWAIIALFN